MAVKKLQTDDIRIAATVKVNSEVQVITELNDIVVVAYRVLSGSKRESIEFALAPTSEQQKLNVVDDAAGKISFVFPRTMTRTMSKGLYLCEVRLQFSAGEEYVNMKCNVGQDAFELFELVESVNATLLTNE